MPETNNLHSIPLPSSKRKLYLLSMNNPISITTASLSRNEIGDAETVERVRLAIGGMTCAGCAAGVSGALNAVDGVQNAVVNLASEQAIVDLRLGGDLKALQVAVTAAGYEATPLEAGAAVEDDRSNAQSAMAG